MHELCRKVAIDYLKDGLSKCTKAQRHLFKRMYAGGDLELTIEAVVERMPDEKLEHAMDQVERTLKKMGE